jgi:hypothetical protein
MNQEKKVKELAKKIAKGSTLLATIESEFPEGSTQDLKDDLYGLISKGIMFGTNVKLNMERQKIAEVQQRRHSNKEKKAKVIIPEWQKKGKVIK